MSLFTHQSWLTLSSTNMDRFGLLSHHHHHHHHHRSEVQGKEEEEESTVLVLDPSIAFLYCFFLLTIVLAAICFNLRRRSNSLTVDLRLVQVKVENAEKIHLVVTGAASAPSSILHETLL